MLRTFAVVVFALLLASANAQQPSIPLTPPQEELAESLFNELRCVVCQNQSIADSDASVAQDLRRVVREQIAGGASGDEVKQFLVTRYGEFVLLKPTFAFHTLFLWASPLIFLVLGAFWAFSKRSGQRRTQTALSAEEQAELDRLLKS